MNPMRRKVSKTRRPAEPVWSERRKRRAGELCRTLAAPSFKYGLGAAYDPASVFMPLERAPEAGGRSTVAVSGDRQAVLSWSEALKNPATAKRLKERASSAPMPADRLWAWHEANCDNGLVIYLPRGRRADQPIKLDYLLAGGMRLDRLLVIAEAGSSATIIERATSKDGGGKGSVPDWRSIDIEVLAEADAGINFLSIQDLGSRTTSFSRRRADCGRRSTVTWTGCHFGGDMIADDVSVKLQGRNARTAIKGLFVGVGNERFDLHYQTEHLAPDTVSDIVSRGVLDDSAQGICRGLIKIRRGAHGCQGRQKADTLLLNDDVQIVTMPDLEIGDDDVSCSHGSATGRLDPEQLFYLMSRGLNRTAATRRLVDGYFAPLLGAMRDSALDEMVACLIGCRFDRKRPKNARQCL